MGGNCRTSGVGPTFVSDDSSGGERRAVERGLGGHATHGGAGSVPLASVRVLILPSTDDPFLPVVGDLYLARTLIFWSGDAHEKRPVMVVEVPAAGFGSIGVVTRTSDLSKPGIRHNRHTDLCLTRDGVFSRYGRVEQSSWTHRNVARLGRAEPEIVGAVLERFS